jgi:polysaccharide chain length determinant protein (PEP-CTERM system associated)
MNVEGGFQLGDLKGIVRRRLAAVLGVALVVSLAAFWLAMALPNEYESYATVLVEPQAVNPELVEAGVQNADLNRRLHLMAAQILSRPRLSRMIDELDLYAEESRYLVRDEVINLMRSHVRVEAVVPELEQGHAGSRRDFTIDQFRIYFRDASPLKARDVAQRLANDFIEEHIQNRVRTSQKSVEFVESELTRLSEAIRRIEREVADFKEANPGRIPQDLPATQRRLERIVDELGDRRREAAAASSDEAFHRSQSATARELMGLATPGVESVSPENRIRVIELALTDFEARGFTEKHPDVVKAKSELATLKEQVESKDSTGVPSSFAEHNAAAEAERARLRRVNAEEEIARLEKAAEEVQQLLAAAPTVAEQLEALDREYRHLFQSYQDFSNRRLEAGVQAQLERRQLGEQFRVLEAAFLAPKPASPKRLVIVAIGLFFGLALGGGVGIVLEASDSSVHSARQLQSSLELPVLAAIPQIWLESDRLRLRRQRLRMAFGTAALVTFALVGGVANYWWVNGGGMVEEPPAAEVPAPVEPRAEPVPAAAAPPLAGVE